MTPLRQLLERMFTEMVLAKDATKTATYYDREFILYSNGKEMGYDEYHSFHEKVYPTPIQYSVRYDDDTFVESGDRLAGRVFITTKMPDEAPKEIEVMLVAKYRDGKLLRLWELTWPDWTQHEELQVAKT